MTKPALWLLMLATLLCIQGCRTQHQVEVKPVEVKPIHITIDVNVKVDRALDEFMGDVYEYRKAEASRQDPETRKK